jgi:hypothetical protein
MALKNLYSDKSEEEVPSKLRRLRLGGINFSVDASLVRYDENQQLVVHTTRSDSLANHLHRNSGCAQSLRNFGSSLSSSGNKGTRNYMAPMAPSQWNGGGKIQQWRLSQCTTRLPSVMYAQRTVLYFTTILALKRNCSIDWTKEHDLDAYLASAELIIEQCDEPG